jgi:ribose transport system ATP-binding protein
VEPLLAIAGLSKRFAGTQALAGVDLDVVPGEVHALLGENGAGKSTLIKILAGVYRADAGRIALRGRAVDPAAEALPISFIHQDLGLVDTMTVAENVAVLAGYRRRAGLISWRRTRAAAAEALEALGGVDPDARVGALRAAERSLVAISRALAVAADLLVLDEPTAALPEADVERLLRALRALRARGLGVVYVTHRLDEVFRIADRVTVLRDGRRVGTRAVAGTRPEELVQMIVGRTLGEVFLRPRSAIGSSGALLRVDGLVTTGAGPVSLELPPGEILALVGLRGAGHHAVGRAVAGDLPVRAGSLWLGGEPYAPCSPAAAVAAGIGFVSSRRGEEGIAPNLAVRENLFVNPAALGRAAWRLLGTAAERREAALALGRFGVRPREPELPVAKLSGGNQQKVVVARWLEARRRLLVLEEPTFGVDVGAKAEIYRLLDQALADGRGGVLLISSDFEEVTFIAHRALVFDRGRIVAEIPRGELTVQHLTRRASAGAAAAA